ncbi:stage 0 sporulation family protein [Chloroflexota bacterium]
MVEIVGIRFKTAGKIYYFDSGGVELVVGEHAVIETGRGAEIGRVVIEPRDTEENQARDPLKKVLRKANDEDMARAAELEAKAAEGLVTCGKLVTELGLPMKLLSGEINMDGNRLTILFSAEERVDFRDLVKRLNTLVKMRVELRQVGSRDEAKMIGGFGKCGRELCCGSFLSDFQPVSIKMAKEQQLPLNPVKISGTCGRLMCCLAYENEQYKQAKANMPRKGQEVETKAGRGRVVELHPLRGIIKVALENGTDIEIPIGELVTSK